MKNSKGSKLNRENSENSVPVFVGSHETQSFIDEIIKTSKKNKENENEVKNWWFWLGFLGGVFISSLGLFFAFTTVYFIQTSILEQPSFGYEKKICEKK